MSLGMFANIVYAITRAKNNGNDYMIRPISFVLGFPFSVLTYVVVEEGSNKVYGIDLNFLN